MIVTLCGSGRFEPWFHAWNLALGLVGHIPIGMCSYKSLPTQGYIGDSEKKFLDGIHRRKIFRSDAILVLNVFGYIGESTMSELTYAQEIGRKVFFLESWGKGCGVGESHFAYLRHACKEYGVPFNASPIDTSIYNGVHALMDAGDAMEGAPRTKIWQIVKDVAMDAMLYGDRDVVAKGRAWTLGKCMNREERYGSPTFCLKTFNHLGKCEFE